MEQLKIVAVDQSQGNLAALKKALNFEDVEIVHEVGFGPIALTWARTLQPDVVLVAAEEPLARSLATMQLLTQGGPTWTVVALAPRFEPGLFRKAVLAGARDMLLRSWGSLELREALWQARQADTMQRAPVSHDPAAPSGTVVTVFGIKGGIGKTTVAANLAVALAQETARSVALVDLDLPFGDVAVMLDLKPERDVLSALDPGVMHDPGRLQVQLTPGPAGVQVLPAPMDPTSKLAVDGEQVGQLVTRLAALYDFVVVDTPPGVNELTAAALDAAALGVLVATPEVTCLRRTQACLQLLQRMEYSTDRVKLLLNRATSKTGIKDGDVESLLGYPVAWRITNDRAAMRGMALGQPPVLASPRTALAADVRRIARQISGLPAEQPPVWRLWPSRAVAALASL
ncbi:MAG TPA: P-loop NTPase [Chloroflexota bacterium]|jgi:pilus assembly protein CpaE